MTYMVSFINFLFGEHRELFISFLAGKWSNAAVPVIGILKVGLQIEDTKELFLSNRVFPKL